MSEYKYDSTGATFVYFFFLLFGSIMTAYSYYVYKSRKQEVSIKEGKVTGSLCDCTGCRKSIIEKKKFKVNGGHGSLFRFRYLLLSGGWTLVAYFMYIIAITPPSDFAMVFDPYKILGVSDNMPLSEIADVRRKLVYEWHPDKAIKRGIDNKLAQEKVAAINKAWDTLKNPEARRKWEEWGDPNGRQSYTAGIALPNWLIEDGNRNMVLGGYIFVFMGLVPFFVRRWWIRLKTLSNNRTISSKSVTSLARYLSGNYNPEKILDLIIELPDFNKVVLFTLPSHPDIKKLIYEVNSLMRTGFYDGWRLPNLTSQAHIVPYMTSLYLHCYLMRIKSDNKEINEDIIRTVSLTDMIISTCISISINKSQLPTFVSLIKLSQWFSQAVYIHHTGKLQLPNVVNNQTRLGSSKNNKKFTLSKIRDYITAHDAQIDESVSYMDDKSKKEFIAALNNIPIIDIENVTFEVSGEDELLVESRITVKIELSIQTLGERREAALHSNSNEIPGKNAAKSLSSKFNDATSALNGSFLTPHCPHHPTKQSYVWWIVMRSPKIPNLLAVAKNNSSMGKSKVVFLFTSPKDPMQIPIVIDVYSDTYIDVDVSKSYRITTVVPKEIPKPIPSSTKNLKSRQTSNNSRKLPPVQKSRGDLDDTSSSEYSSDDNEFSQYSYSEE